jgi:hypothetical protein
MSRIMTPEVEDSIGTAFDSIYQPHSMAYYNGYIYVGQRFSSGKIAKLGASDYSDELLVVLDYGGGPTGYISDMLVEGGYLWVVASDGYLYKVSPTDLSVLGGWSFFPEEAQAVKSDGSFLYLAGYAGWVGKFNLSTEAVTTAQITDGNIHALLEDGDYLYVSDIENQYIRKVQKSDLSEVDNVSVGLGIVDDAAQDDTYCYFGVETGDVGVIRVQKSDLSTSHVKYTPMGKCWGVFEIGGYLLYLDADNNWIWVLNMPSCSVRSIIELNLSGTGGIAEVVEDANAKLHFCQFWCCPTPIFRLDKGEVLAPISSGQSFFPITPVAVTPASSGSWEDVNAGAYGVPSGATGVLLHFVNTHASNAYAIGMRKNGSTDNRISSLYANSHAWAAIGVDFDRIFEAYIGDTTDIDIYLIGYTGEAVTFFNNAYDKSLGVTGSWETINCSAEAPNAIGLIFEVVTTSVLGFGLRKTGSSDNRTNLAGYHNAPGVVIGCDGSQTCEGNISNIGVDFHLLGYITQGVTFNTNATDFNLGTTGAWTDLDSIGSGKVFGIIEIISSGNYKYGLRKDGSGEDIYYRCMRHSWGIVECSAAGIIEGEIEDGGVDFFHIGSALSGWTGKIAGVTNPAKVMGVAVANIAKVKGVASA